VARKGWDSLSGSYRERLERGGVDRAAYGRGESLSSARGHAGTPERPLANFEDVPERYRAYAELRNDIVDLKRALYDHTGNFSEDGVRAGMRGKSRATLTKAHGYLDEMLSNRYTWTEMLEMYPELQDDEWDWLGHYH